MTNSFPGTTVVDRHVKGIMRKHQEALVIYLDQDVEGESNISAFFKLIDGDSPLRQYLIRLLQELLKSHEKRGSVPSQAPIGPQTDQSACIADYQSSC